jgi:hypothetical protein
MSLVASLAEVLVRPAPAKRATNLLDALLWRVLLGFSMIFIFIAFWRVLENSLGPILAPLVMALALAILAGVLAFNEARRKRRLKTTTPPLAPLVATVLEIAFAPKLVRWFALGSLMYDVLTGTSPLAPGSKRRSNK